MSELKAVQMEQEICQMYLAGKNYHAITKKFKIGPPKVRKILLQNSIEPRANKKAERLSKSDKQKVIDLYRSGESYRDIAKIFSCSTHCIKKSLEESDISIRRLWYTKFKTHNALKNLKDHFLKTKSLSGAAKEFGCSRDAVFNGLLKAGFDEQKILSNISHVYKSNGYLVFMKSNNEFMCAHYLDFYNLNWKYEPETIRFDSDSYLPDFIVYNSKLEPAYIIDAKGVSSHISMRRYERIITIINNVYPQSTFLTTNETNVELIIEGISRRI
jgi:SAM-dependent methyltransferase